MLNNENEKLIRILQMKKRSNEVLHGSNKHGYDFTKPVEQWSEDATLFYLEYVQGNISKDKLPVVPPLAETSAAVKKLYLELETYDRYIAYKLPVPPKYKPIFDKLKNAGVFMGFVQLYSKSGKLSTALDIKLGKQPSYRRTYFEVIGTLK